MKPPLYDPARHEPLAAAEWNVPRVRDSIAAICRDAESAFDPRRFWPLHPDDDDLDISQEGILRGLYGGAAGMLHALDQLRRSGLYEPSLDLAAIADGLHEAGQTPPDEEGAGSSLMFGVTGTLLVAHRLSPSAAAADALADAIAANADHPANELLYGAPGYLLAARTMHARTGEERFAELWKASARTLLDRQEHDGLWTHDLAGQRDRWIGAGHGFAGNMMALLAAPEWLDDPAGLETRALDILRAFAIVDGEFANWPVIPGGSRSGTPPRLQWCHGSAGIVTSLARMAPNNEAHGELMNAAGELVWAAGPMAASAGLCHGTAGNGFAFLSLFVRTKNERWLARARAFAMHALEQVERLRAITGRGQHTLFTGDAGVALFAAACLTGRAGFPGLDDLEGAG